MSKELSGLFMSYSPLCIFSINSLWETSRRFHRSTNLPDKEPTELLRSSVLFLFPAFRYTDSAFPCTWNGVHCELMIQGKITKATKGFGFCFVGVFSPLGWPDESAQRVVWLSEPAQSNQQQWLARQEQVLQLPVPVPEKCLATQVLHCDDPLRNLAHCNLPLGLSLHWKLSRSDFPTTFYFITLPTSGIS